MKYSSEYFYSILMKKSKIMNDLFESYCITKSISQLQKLT